MNVCIYVEEWRERAGRVDFLFFIVLLIVCGYVGGGSGKDWDRMALPHLYGLLISHGSECLSVFIGVGGEREGDGRNISFPVFMVLLIIKVVIT